VEKRSGDHKLTTLNADAGSGGCGGGGGGGGISAGSSPTAKRAKA
jgi:hypothetical protein